MIRKITEVELKKPNCKPTLIFSCSSCQKEFPFEEAYCIVGHGKIIKNSMSEDIFAMPLYCKECVGRI
jgi:hypothetical protein